MNPALCKIASLCAAFLRLSRLTAIDVVCMHVMIRVPNFPRGENAVGILRCELPVRSLRGGHFIVLASGSACLATQLADSLDRNEGPVQCNPPVKFF